MFQRLSSSWLFQKGYFQGVFWIILVSLTSSLNDVLMRLAGNRLPSMEVAFFRFLFATLTLLPLMIYQGKKAFATGRPLWHAGRAILGFGAVAFWCAGVSREPLAVASTMALTVPLFVLPMAVLFLKEHVGLQRTLATLAGFGGIWIIINGNHGEDFFMQILRMENGSLFLIAAAILFALSDILNKKLVSKESDMTLLFYFALGTSLCGALPAYMVWVEPAAVELFWLLCLGLGGNLILFFLLKAFAATDVSALAPYRYVELLFAGAFGWAIFQEMPTSATLLGAAVIIPSTFLIAYYESRARKNASPQAA